MTEDIRLYSLDFKLLCIVHRVKSSSWEIYYNKIGSFEAHISIDEFTAPIIFDTPYLIACEGQKQAFCTAVQMNTEIVIYGKTLNYLLSKRTVMPFSCEAADNNPVIFCNSLVTDVFINDRTITDAYGNSVIMKGVSDMVTVNNSADFTTAEKKFYRTAAHPLSEVITERLDNDKLGHRLVFDTVNKVWRFEVYKGNTVPLVLSSANRNFFDMDYTSNISGECNAGFYEPQDSSEDSESTGSDAEEKDRIYKFVSNDKYNNKDFAICEWDEIVTGTAPSEALNALKEKISTEEITGAAANLNFGIDYCLGDVLRVQLINNGIKRTLSRRVTGVKFYRENNEKSAEPILEEV